MIRCKKFFFWLNYYISKSKTEFISVNLGTGKGFSVLELVKTFEEVNNCKIPIKFVKRRAGDKSIVVADNSLAIKRLNWSPKKNIKNIYLGDFATSLENYEKSEKFSSNKFFKENRKKRSR